VTCPIGEKLNYTIPVTFYPFYPYTLYSADLSKKIMSLRKLRT